MRKCLQLVEQLLKAVNETIAREERYPAEYPQKAARLKYNRLRRLGRLRGAVKHLQARMEEENLKQLWEWTH
ncbi:MAG: hypothetical protein IJG32_05955 [Selenomonadaceae bacterium]|nr:hypothetical protein [Selenomonadaceae bacterium]